MAYYHNLTTIDIAHKDYLIKYYQSNLNSNEYILFNHSTKEEELIFFVRKDENLLLFIEELFQIYLKDTNWRFHFSERSFSIPEVDLFMLISTWGKNWIDTISWPFFVDEERLWEIKKKGITKCYDLLLSFENTLPF